MNILKFIYFTSTLCSVLIYAGLSLATIINTSVNYSGYHGILSDNKSANFPLYAPYGKIDSAINDYTSYFGAQGRGFASADSNGYLYVSSSQYVSGIDLGNTYKAFSSFSEKLINEHKVQELYFLNLWSPGASLMADYEGWGSYEIDVFLDGFSIWNRSGVIHGGGMDDTDSTPTFSTSGPFSESLYLGMLGYHDSFTLLYSISVTVKGTEYGISSAGLDFMGTVVSTPTPEPATMLLFGAGIAGLAAVGRRKRN